MKKIQLLFLLLLIAIPLITKAQSSNEIQTNGKVCPKPSSPCGKNFQDADLSFKLPAKLVWQRNYYSASFYAIILKSRTAVNDENVDDVNCQKGYYSETDREKVQNIFPNNKVFASRNGCYMPTIWYTNTNYKYEFVAVYAGETQAEATKFLKQVKVKKEFSDANIRKMKVVYGFGD